MYKISRKDLNDLPLRKEKDNESFNLYMSDAVMS